MFYRETLYRSLKNFLKGGQAISPAYLSPAHVSRGIHLGRGNSGWAVGGFPCQAFEGVHLDPQWGTPASGSQPGGLLNHRLYFLRVLHGLLPKQRAAELCVDPDRSSLESKDTETGDSVREKCECQTWLGLLSLLSKVNPSESLWVSGTKKGSQTKAIFTTSHPGELPRDGGLPVERLTAGGQLEGVLPTSESGTEWGVEAVKNHQGPHFKETHLWTLAVAEGIQQPSDSDITAAKKKTLPVPPWWNK